MRLSTSVGRQSHGDRWAGASGTSVSCGTDRSLGLGDDGVEWKLVGCPHHVEQRRPERTRNCQ